MVLFRTIEILQLQYTDKVIDVPVVPVQFPSAGVERLPSSHIAVVELWTRSLTCPCVQRQVPVAQFNNVVDVAVIIAATSSRQCREVPQTLFIDKMFTF